MMKVKRSIELDKFYTPLYLCIELTEILYQNNFFDNKTDIIEPSAGSGNFVKALELLKSKYNLTSNIHAYDIAPEPQDGLITPIIQSDFFKVNLKTFNAETTGVIGNPPFGHAGCLLKKFLRHCTKYFNDIAFIGNGSSFKVLTINKFYINEYFTQILSFPIKDKFSYNDELKNIRETQFIYFKKGDTINENYLDYVSVTEKFKEYATVVKKINNEAHYCYSIYFKLAGKLYTIDELPFTQVSSITVNINKISLDKFKEVWESSLRYNTGKYGDALCEYNTIKQFLINIKL